MQKNVPNGSSEKVQQIIDNVTKSISGLIELLQNSQIKMDTLKSPHGKASSVLNLESSMDPNCVGYKRGKRFLNVKERNAMTCRRVKRQRSTMTGESQGVHSSSSTSESISFDESDSSSAMSFFSQEKEKKLNPERNWIVNRFINEMPPLIKKPETCECEEKESNSFTGRKRKIVARSVQNGIRMDTSRRQLEMSGNANSKLIGSVTDKFKVETNNGARIEKEENPVWSIGVCNNLSARNEEDSDRSRLEKELLGTRRIKIDPEIKESDLRRCSACRDTFYLDIGFKEHLKRRTVRINYTCHDCKSNLEFFNRCQLILHIQMHGKKANIHSVFGVTKTQPLAMCDLEMHMEYTDGSNEEDNSKLQEKIKMGENEVGIEINGERGNEGREKSALDDVDGNIHMKSHSLSEASTILELQTDDDWLVKMSSSKDPTDEQTNILTCGNLEQFWNINPTVLIAEKSETLEEFGEIEILKSQNEISAKIEAQIEQESSDNEPCDFFKGLEKCQFCTKLVLPSVWKHHEKQCGARMTDILRGYCITCKKDFKSVGRLAKHGLEDHCSDGNLVCIFCNNKTLDIRNEGIGGEMKALKKHMFHSHAFKRKEFPYNCELCNEVCEDKKKMGEHLVLHQLNSIPITNGCEEERSELGNKTEHIGIANGKEILVSYCPACKGKEFNHLKLLERHLIKVHKITLEPRNLKKLSMRKMTNAKRFAGVIINPEMEILNQPQKSLEEKSQNSAKHHPYKPKLQKDEAIKTELSSPIKLYSRPFASPFFKGKRNKISNEEITSLKRKQFVNVNGEVEVKSIPVVSRARREDGVLVCLKCKDFETNTEDEFLSHVKSTHVWSLEDILNRSVEGGAEKSDFWCPECDMTFVSKSTLSMHLKVHHEFIRDVIYYMEQLGYEGAIPLLEHQCEVCFLYCENNFALQKHFRSHGLAFLRMQQERRAKEARVKEEPFGN